MPTVIVQVTGGKEVEAKLKRLGSGLLQLDKGFRQIGEYMSNYFANEAFASQGQVFGATWPRLNMKYSIWKAQHFPGRPPLVRTGAMQRGFAFKAGSQSVSIGNTVPYFPYSQLGTSRMPQRKMMGINDTNKRMISNILREEIKLKLARA